MAETGKISCERKEKPFGWEPGDGEMSKRWKVGSWIQRAIKEEGGESEHGAGE